MSDTRNTFQRIKIVEYLKSTKTHPTAEMVYKEVVKDLPTISLATVYRNLNLLAAHGEVLKFEVNGEYRFDGLSYDHAHLVCLNCGKVMDLEQKDIVDYAMKKIDAKNFIPKHVNVIFHGVCKECK